MDALVGLSFGLLLTLFLLYLLPTFIAFARGHRNRVPILLVNVFLGWSFLGWLVALIWSFTSNTKSNEAHNSSPVTAGVASSVVVNVAQSNAPSGGAAANGADSVPSSAVARVGHAPGSAGFTMSAQPPPIPQPDAIEQSAPQSKQWFYQTSGEKRGPVTADEMVRRVRVGSLERGSMVWSEGFPAWTAIEATELGAHVSVGQSSVVSAATDRDEPRVDVSNAVMWVLAFAPILGVVLETIVAFVVYGGDHARVLDSVSGSSFWYVTLALNSILCLIDEKNLEQAGVDEGLFKWVLLVPVYIYKRAKAVGDDLSYFVTWFVSVAIAAFLMISAIPAGLAIYADYDIRSAVTQRVAAASEAKAAVAEFYATTGEFPATCGAVGGACPDGVTIQAGGVVSVDLGSTGIAELVNTTISLTPSVNEIGDIRFACTSSAPGAYVPSVCRRAGPADAEREMAAAEAERVMAMAEAERLAAYQQQQRADEQAMEEQRQAAIDAYTQQLQAEAAEESAVTEQAGPSVESSAAQSMVEASPVVTQPSTLGPGARITQPKYPAASRRAGEEGTVSLQVYVLANGKPGEVQLLESSGFEKLDEAAIREVERKWRFVPGQQDGKPAAMWHTLSVTFSLSG